MSKKSIDKLSFKKYPTKKIDFGFDKIGSFFAIVHRDMLQDEKDIFLIVALNKEDALTEYAREYYSKDKLFIEDVEDRYVGSFFWSEFFVPEIFEERNGGYVMVINDDEFDSKIEEVSEIFLDGNKSLASELIAFYFNEDKTFEELSEELKVAIALKNIQKEGKDIIIKRYN